MPNTPLLGITQVAANQNSKEITINDAILALEGAIAAVKTISYAATTDYTLTAAETTRNMVFKVTSAATNIVLRFPNSIAGNPTDRTVVVMNKSGRQLTVRTASGAGTTVVIPNAASRLISIVNGTDVEVAAQPSTLVNFVDLADGPGSYAGKAGKVIAVNQAENKLDFVDVVAFPSYVGNAGKVLVVNGSATGVAWVDYATNFLALTDTPNTYAGQAGKAVMVNEAGNGLAFVDLPEVEAVEFLPAKRWRVRTLALDPTADKAAWGEIEFLNADGVDLTGLGGGASVASSISIGKDALYAFDNNLSAGNGWMSDTTDATTSWIEFEFAVSQVVRKVRLTPIDQLPQYSPTEFIVERYNGTEWVSAGQRQPNVWVSGVSQTFVITGTPLESVTEAPSDNQYYARRNGQWAEILEVVRDNLSTVLGAGPDSHISITVDDNANKIWIAVDGEFGINEEEFVDLLGAKIAAGDDNIQIVQHPSTGVIEISLGGAVTTGESYRGEWSATPESIDFEGVVMPSPIRIPATAEGWEVVDFPDAVGGYTRALTNRDINSFDGTEFSFDIVAAEGDTALQFRLAMDYQTGDTYYVKVDDVTVLSGSPFSYGVALGEYIEVSHILTPGPHKITIGYGKDSSGSVGTDRVYFSNIVLPGITQAYRFGDIVDYNDERFLCLRAGTTNDPSNTLDWQNISGSGGAGGALPTGGTTGQFLVKLSNTTGDLGWADVPPFQIADATDVNISAAQDEDVLVWDAAEDKVVPVALADILPIVALTQVQYDALPIKDANTFYFIVN